LPQVGILKIVCPVAMMKNKGDYKIIEKFLRKSQAPLVSIYCF